MLLIDLILFKEDKSLQIIFLGQVLMLKKRLLVSIPNMACNEWFLS